MMLYTRLSTTHTLVSHWSQSCREHALFCGVVAHDSILAEIMSFNIVRLTWQMSSNNEASIDLVVSFSGMTVD